MCKRWEWDRNREKNEFGAYDRIFEIRIHHFPFHSTALHQFTIGYFIYIEMKTTLTISNENGLCTCIRLAYPHSQRKREREKESKTKVAFGMRISQQMILQYNMISIKMPVRRKWEQDSGKWSVFCNVTKQMK